MEQDVRANEFATPAVRRGRKADWAWLESQAAGLPPWAMGEVSSWGGASPSDSCIVYLYLNST